MTKKPTSFDELLELWETPKALSIALGVPYVNAQAMKRRKSVDVTHWPRLVQLMAARGIVITSDDLVQMAVKRREAA
jgi:hypothetical protein